MNNVINDDDDDCCQRTLSENNCYFSNLGQSMIELNAQQSHNNANYETIDGAASINSVDEVSVNLDYAHPIASNLQTSPAWAMFPSSFRETDGQQIPAAAKIYYSRDCNFSRVSLEAVAYASASEKNPHFLRILGVAATVMPSTGTRVPVLLLEKPQTTLEQKIQQGSCTLTQRLEFASQVIDGMQIRHREGSTCTVQNLTSSNIFIVDDETVKIGSIFLDLNSTATAPEFVKSASNSPTHASDIFGFGSLLLSMLVGTECSKNIAASMCFSADESWFDEKLIQKHSQNDATRRDCLELCFACLRIDPSKRLSVGEIRRRLQILLAKTDEHRVSLSFIDEVDDDKIVQQQLAPQNLISSLFQFGFEVSSHLQAVTKLQRIHQFETPHDSLSQLMAPLLSTHPAAAALLVRLYSEFPNTFVFLPSYIDYDSAEPDLGSGTFGTVKKAFIIPRGNKVCAAKFFGPKRLEVGIAEAKNAIKISNDNITEFYGVTVTNEDRPRLVVLMELAKSDFKKFLAQIPDFELNTALIRRFATDIASGLAYLHSETASKTRIVHCDLKTSNILVVGTSNILKIGDLGGIMELNADGTRADGEATSGFMYTRSYVPPEFLLRRNIAPTFDVFAFGIILLHMISGKSYNFTRIGPDGAEFVSPHCSQGQIDKVLQKVFRGELSVDSDERKSCVEIDDIVCEAAEVGRNGKGLKDLCSRCLMVNPKHRPQDGSELLQMLLELPEINARPINDDDDNDDASYYFENRKRGAYGPVRLRGYNDVHRPIPRFNHDELSPCFELKFERPTEHEPGTTSTSSTLMMENQLE